MRTIFLGLRVLVVVWVFLSTCEGQPAFLDTTFDPHLNPGAQVYTLALQNDGRILVGGAFTSIGGTAVTNIARLNQDGSLDLSFNPGSAADIGFVNSIAIQTDGRVVLGGAFSSSTGLVPANLARLNADGTADTSFDSALLVDNAVNAVRVQSDGKILFGGAFIFVNQSQRRSVARLKSDGTLDTSFDACVSSSSGDGATDLALLNDGKILASGRLVFSTGSYRDGIARLNECGDIDASYAPQPGVDLDRVAYTLAVRPDGRALLGGNFSLYHGEAHRGVVQLTTNGVPDPSFNPATGVFFGVTVNAIALQDNGKVLVGGSFTESSGQTRYRVAQIGLEGEVNVEFDPGSGPNNSVGFILVQSDGSLVVAGKFSSFDGVARNGMARLIEGVPNHLPIADATATKQLSISPDGMVATVTLDASHSSDPDNDSLQYAWYDTAQTEPVATGILTVVVLSVGEHPLELIVSDGQGASTNEITVQVITQAQALGRLIDLVNGQTSRPKPLLATLRVALLTLNRGNRVGTASALFAFETQVRALVARASPALAEDLIHAAQEIRNTLIGGHIRTTLHSRDRGGVPSWSNRDQKRHEQTP